MKKITDTIKQQVIDLKKEGKTYKDIIEILHISKGSVSNICKDAGLYQYIELTPQKIEECQKLYDEIGNIKKVAKETKISYSRLRNVIQSKNITAKDSYAYVKKHRKSNKEELIAYKGGKCEICGYNKCIAALDFHHIDPSKKDFGISATNIYKNIEALKKEADKCILVCANCHRELHYQKNKDSKQVLKSEKIL